ncbi:MAG: coproporphyrinogen dehydrogenase HemZ [Clostridia bacterium]|nr:coproporphyrinogen dehydrogenase HemZ [Clostridia bacterium]
MKVYTNFNYPTEICDVVKLFFADATIVEQPPFDIKVTEHVEGTLYTYIATFFAKVEMQYVDIANIDDLQATRLKKRFAKLAIYNLLQKVTHKSMPWGSLTGIRPTKLACQLQSEGLDWQTQFTDILGVSEQKTKLVKTILDTQGELRNKKENVADMYIGIPFCVSRCSYCSFTSGEIERLKQYVEPYVAALKQDITQTIQFAKDNGITIKNVYFGGGTPTSLSASQLDEIMDCINFSPVEYTVEAGRPDTIDEDKLKVLKKHGVHRISINPQTFNQSVLDIIGRKHTVQDIYDKYNLAKKYGFDVNMDLIAGLPNESYEMFCHSIDSAIALQPENITVHTLALKHGAALKLQNYSSADKDVSSMVEYAQSALHNAGYLPYYMYRQKYMMENLENVGFCKPGKPCLYNIGIMEEISDILACGTNGISKKLFSDQNRIERAANAKDVITYIQRTQDYIDKKFQLFLSVKE